MKKSRRRTILVILCLIAFAIYMGISLRGEYLQTLEIGEQYLSVFWQNTRFKLEVGIINFIVIYFATYITTRFIRRGLKKFFQEEKKEMPKLPTKSISLFFAIIATIATSSFLTQKAIMAINTAYFGINDPIFNLDIGFYMFQKPFIETLILYFIVVTAVYLVYIALYYIIVFNVYFEKGIDPATLKKNTFIKHIITNIILIVIGLSLLTLINVQDIVYGKFLNLGENTSVIGAGLAETTIRVWGYRIFAVVILVCAIMAINNFKKEKFKKVMIWLSSIPIYLVILFLVMLGFDLIYVNNNELDKEKEFIEYNIGYTKNAYNINIEEIEIESSGAITSNDIIENKEVVNEINLLNKEVVLENLRQYRTNSGFYSFNIAQIDVFNDNGEERLVYTSPREIVNNDTRTYNNKTYEYTHGYGTITVSASSVDENDNLEYIKSEFGENGRAVEPRIYFGLETNSPIIINAKNKTEYDYPESSTTSATNTYNGTAGLKLGFFDRFVLGIKEKNLGIAFSGDITKDSIIITTRNIIERAKVIMPYLQYDENPYMIVTDDGKQYWVLDAYTTSDSYPYSQETIVEYEGIRRKINYIRNSVKVIIDPYNGTTEFYITDTTDPIVMAYKNMYPGLFMEGNIPESIAKHIVYSEYLYKIQATVLEQYHNIQPEVLYRQDDVWAVAKENTTRISGTASTKIKPYYTMVKTVNNDSATLGLVIPYTISGKQNLISYLVGTYDNSNNQKLVLYKLKSENAVLGTTQLDTMVEQDGTISQELNNLNTPGTKIVKNIIVIPINNTLLYVEPIYQEMLNEETQLPVLKKVIVASGNKVAIGKNISEALENLVSQQAIKIEFVSENKDELIEQIINANKNLEQSNTSGNWEMIGKDMAKLQDLIKQLEAVTEQEKEQKEKQEATTNTNKKSENLNEVVNSINLSR